MSKSEESAYAVPLRVFAAIRMKDNKQTDRFADRAVFLGESTTSGELQWAEDEKDAKLFRSWAEPIQLLKHLNADANERKKAAQKIDEIFAKQQRFGQRVEGKYCFRIMKLQAVNASEVCVYSHPDEPAS